MACCSHELHCAHDCATISLFAKLQIASSGKAKRNLKSSGHTGEWHGFCCTPSELRVLQNSYLSSLAIEREKYE